MAKNNSSNQDYTNNSDGWDLSGGTTKRKLTVTGGDMTLTGSGANTYTFPASTDTLVGRASSDTLTNKILTAPTIAQINNSSAPGVKVQLNVQTDNSNVIANTTQAGLIVQYGWGQIFGPGTTTMTDTVTFQTAFTTVLGASVSWLGYKSGGAAATDVTGFNTGISNAGVIQPLNLTTSGFTFTAISSSAFGGAYHGYSWIAWGI